MKIKLFLILFAAALILTGCHKDQKPVADLSVVCSTTSLTSVAKALSENTAISIHQVVPDNNNVHTFSLSQKDMKSIHDADLVIIYSPELEFWASGIPSGKLLVINKDLKNFEPIFVSKDSVNPHTWLDPVYECEIIDLISDRFSVINPSAKESYKGKAKRLQENIRKLHKNMEADASAGMLKDVYVVCSHPSLAYFFKRYGIDNVDYIQTGDGEEPSVKHLNRLISKARSAKRCVVICEEQINDKAADTIIRESGAEKVEFNPQTPNYADDMWRLFVSLTD